MYCKDNEPFYHSFMYSPVSLFSPVSIQYQQSIHCLLHQMLEIYANPVNLAYFTLGSCIRDFITWIKSVFNYLPRCTYHLLYLFWYYFLRSGKLACFLTIFVGLLLQWGFNVDLLSILGLENYIISILRKKTSHVPNYNMLAE